MAISPSFGNFALALALAFFFGLAFEDFYGRAQEHRPGGVRTFPMLALMGGVLTLLDPVHLVPLCAGLFVVGGWVAIYYFHRVGDVDTAGQTSPGMMVPVCNILAFLIGPAALSQPVWVPVGMTAAAVLFLTGRDRLHSFARQIEIAELVTAGKFLVLTGLVLPLLPDYPVTPLTPVTPRQAWLALVAVSTISYASYLLQRYVLTRGVPLITGILGGLYSSTATTIFLARSARTAGRRAEFQSGIVLSTAVMYLRILGIVAVFNIALAREISPYLLGLAGVAALFAVAWHLVHRAALDTAAAAQEPRNPLAFSSGFAFAASFVAISIAVAWARAHFGAGGLYAIAAVVGIADVDPFVLNLAQSDSAAPFNAGMAIIAAASSNNLLKAAYAAFAGGRKAGTAPALALAALAAAGLAIVAFSL